MKFILETERLILRELNPNDDMDFYELNLNPKVLIYTGDKAFKSIEEARIFLENYCEYRVNGYGRWAVINKSTGKFIVWCGLKYGEIGNETDIGFRFFEKDWNKGFATESALGCLNYGFQKLALNRIIARAMKKNIASIKVLEKIGLEYEKDVDFEGHRGVIYKIEK
jgi:RimJ/RimL family protein N-acetyltransferase